MILTRIVGAALYAAVAIGTILWTSATLDARASARQAAEVDSAMIIPQAARDSESARLRALGAKLPQEGLILERPWDPPFTRRRSSCHSRGFAGAASTR